MCSADSSHTVKLHEHWELKFENLFCIYVIIKEKKFDKREKYNIIWENKQTLKQLQKKF